MISIYYTVGPCCKELTREMFAAGAQGVRQTFSYGTPEIQLELAKKIRKEAQKDGIQPFIIADLEGGGFRLGEFTSVEDGRQSVSVLKDEIILCVHAKEHDLSLGTVLPIPDILLLQALLPGDILVVGDGSAEFVVLETSPQVRVRSVFDGVVEGRRGLWRQSVHSSHQPECLTAKDLRDLEHIATHKEYDAVALSFVSSSDDILQAKKIIKQHGGTQKIIAKIETVAAVESIDDICKEADQIMVARGDLLLAVSWQRLPEAVEKIVTAALRNNTPYIMATQVAEGMMHGSHLTRAELCDLWQWKQKGMSGVLLSRETCWGEKAVLAVERVRGLLD